MKMKNIALTLLASLTIALKIEGMEKLQDSPSLEKRELLEQEELASCSSLSLSSSLYFFDLGSDVQKQDYGEGSSSRYSSFSFSFPDSETREEDYREAYSFHSELLQSDLFQELVIGILSLYSLEFFYKKSKSEGWRDSNIKRIFQHFKNKEETLNFLKLLEESESKYQSYILEIGKRYEEFLKDVEIKNKRDQLEAIETIKAHYGAIKKLYSTIRHFELSSGDEDMYDQSIITTFNLDPKNAFKYLHISVGNNINVKDIDVNFNNLGETYLFLGKLSRLAFLSSPIHEKIEGIMESVVALLKSREQPLVM